MSNHKGGKRKIIKCNKFVNRANSEKDKRQKGEIIYVAIDSCIVFDLNKQISRRGDFVKNKNYISFLSRLLSSNILDGNGEKNIKGRYAICILPSVLKELTSPDGELYTNAKELMENRFIPIKINPDYEEAFNKKVNQLVKLYNKAGYFLDNHGNPTNDAYILAEASIFNLNLITQDKHFTIEKTKKESEQKIEKIKYINRRVIGGDFDGYQAEPQKIDNFFYQISKGDKIPTIQNTQILTKDTQKMLEAPISVTEEIQRDL